MLQSKKRGNFYRTKPEEELKYEIEEPEEYGEEQEEELVSISQKPTEASEVPS